MTIRHSRFLALFLALTLAVSMIPGGLFVSSAVAEEYGMVINSSVKLRKETSSGSASWFTLPIGWVCTIQSTKTVSGKLWYRVIAPHPDAPDPTKARTYWGYILSDYFRPLTDGETQEYLKYKAVTGRSAASSSSSSSSSSSGSSTGGAAVAGTAGSITNGGTNFREGPGKKYHSMMKLDRGTVVNITSIPDAIGEDFWYGVSYDGKMGYVNSEFIRLISGGAAANVTVSPTATPTPPPSTDGYNAVQLITTSAHLRLSPNGSFDKDDDWLGKGSVLPLNGTAVSKSGYVWYPVSKNGKTYYVRNDCVQLVNSSGASSGASVTPAPASSASSSSSSSSSGSSVLGYVTTIVGGCNLRSTMGGTVIKQIGKGVTLPYLIKPTQKGGYTWYYVDAGGNKGYLRSDVVKVKSSSSDDSGSAAAPETSAASVVDASATGYVKTTSSSVNLRTKAGYSSMIGRIDPKGTVMPYYGTPSVVNGVTWYKVRHSTLGYGYVHGSYVSVVNSDGSATPTPVPTAAPTGVVVTGGSQTEASYPTLKIGSTGTAVKNLVQALKNRGFYSGSVTDKYTTSVESAVKAYQKSAGLSVDGIAGPATQHSLYGTVPVGASDASNLTMTLYPAEKVDWWTGGINGLWAKGANYKVYDVKTGIVWWAHRWSGGYHVDAEPLTAADTARLCKAYGVTAASEIQSKNLYQRRPSLVTIGSRTFACSLYGVPHNYPEGDTISTNNFKGQVCLHFTNSWTHGSKKVDSLHTDAIQFAWENAPNGHK